MRLSRRLLSAAIAVSALTALTACANHPIGNTNNHISTGPQLPEVNPDRTAPTSAG